MTIGTKGLGKKTPFEVVVLCGVVDNENGVIRKFHPGQKEPTILRVPQDISYRNAATHIGARRMEWRDPEKYPRGISSAPMALAAAVDRAEKKAMKSS